MTINMNQETFTKFNQLKATIVDEAGNSISSKKLMQMMVDVFHEKLIQSGRDKG